MDKDLFLNKVQEQLLGDEETLNFESEFREHGSYDSLTGMTIIVMLKDEYGVEITEKDFRSKVTIQDLYEYVLLNKK